MSGRLASLGASLGIGDRETLSWAMYDWANSAFVTTTVAAVLPVYYESVVGATLPGNLASVYWGYTTAASLLFIALASPVLGAIADYMGAKKRFMGAFVVLGVVASGLLFFMGEGDWLLTSVIYVFAYVGFAGANVFYDSLLPHVADDEEIDRLSSAGYALGYLGGGLLLAVNLVWILNWEAFGLPSQAFASRLALFSVAVWWLVFSIPVFRNVEEPDAREREAGEEDLSPVRAGFGRIRTTFSEIRRYRQLFVFLLAFWLYADGIGTIIKMATIYGATIGIGQTDLIGALVMVQFVGIPFAFAFGKLTDYISTKSGLFLGLLVYTGITVGGYFMSEAWHFWALAFAVGMVQGGTQALSRSLYGSMVPKARSSEFFGFFSVSSKFAGIAGPFLFSFVGQLTGSSRLSIVSLIVFFVGGMALLAMVDVEEGQQLARYVDREGQLPDEDYLSGGISHGD